jgi:hypothetical protein
LLEGHCHSERSEESLTDSSGRIPRKKSELFESLASCFAFRCSAFAQHDNTGATV